MAETEQGDTVSSEGETVKNVSNSPVKRGRGRPQGSKKLKVCDDVIDVCESVLPRRGSGRPKLSETEHTAEQSSGDDLANSSVQSHKGRGRPKGSKNRSSNPSIAIKERFPKRGGRPKKSAVAEDLLNGFSGAPKRGRPKASQSNSEMSGEKEGSSGTPGKRGRPKGSLNKKPRMMSSEGERDLLPRRGRPKKEMVKRSVGLGAGGSQPIKGGRGRPKGSLNKKPPAYRVLGKIGRPLKVSGLTGRGRKRGQPRQQPDKRGRPRKYPLPSPEELKRPKVWKPLGRPRKYPRVDPPEGSLPRPFRGRGRPRKSDSKKGAHLRKNFPASPSTPQILSGEPEGKGGSPPSSVRNEADTPRKRGRPRSSVNKNSAKSESQLSSMLPNHSKAGSDSVASEMDHNTEKTPIKQTDDTVDVQDVNLDISEQA